MSLADRVHVARRFQRSVRIDTAAPTVPSLVSPQNNRITNAVTVGFFWTRASDAGSGATNYQVITNGVPAALVPWSQTNWTSSIAPLSEAGVCCSVLRATSRTGTSATGRTA